MKIGLFLFRHCYLLFCFILFCISLPLPSNLLVSTHCSTFQVLAESTRGVLPGAAAGCQPVRRLARHARGSALPRRAQEAFRSDERVRSRRPGPSATPVVRGADGPDHYFGVGGRRCRGRRGMTTPLCTQICGPFVYYTWYVLSKRSRYLGTYWYTFECMRLLLSTPRKKKSGPSLLELVGSRFL